MATAVAIALVTASAFLNPSLSGARPSACRPEIVTTTTPEDPAILQSLERIESDWTGFAELSGSTNVPAK
jgi:hypothetical protein